MTDQVITLLRAGGLRAVPDWGDALATAWTARAEALATYRAKLTAADGDADTALEALLHMHHNRLRGIDREGETVCRRIARQAAVAWCATQGGGR